MTLREIRQYRYGVRYAACLARLGVATEVTTDENGIPVYTMSPGATYKGQILVEACPRKATSTDREREREAAVRGCKARALPAVDSCCARSSPSRPATCRRCR